MKPIVTETEYRKLLRRQALLRRKPRTPPTRTELSQLTKAGKRYEELLRDGTPRYLSEVA